MIPRYQTGRGFDSQKTPSDAMKRLLQPALWWVYKRLRPVHSIDGLQFIDIRMAEEGSEPLIERLIEAVQYLAAAGSDYKKIVTEELDFVAASRQSRESISPRLKAYISPFVGHEGNDSFYLAARLVWIASYLRLHRQAAQQGGVPEETRIRQQSFENQNAFIEAFPNSTEWKDYLERENPGGIH